MFRHETSQKHRSRQGVSAIKLFSCTNRKRIEKYHVLYPFSTNTIPALWQVRQRGFLLL